MKYQRKIQQEKYFPKMLLTTFLFVTHAQQKKPSSWLDFLFVASKCHQSFSPSVTSNFLFVILLSSFIKPLCVCTWGTNLCYTFSHFLTGKQHGNIALPTLTDMFLFVYYQSFSLSFCYTTICSHFSLLFLPLQFLQYYQILWYYQ